MFVCGTGHDYLFWGATLGVRLFVLSRICTLYLSQALRLRAEFPVRSNPPFLLPFGDFGAGGALISGGGVVAGLVVAFAAAEKMPVTGRCTFELVVLAAAAGGGGGGGGEACRLATGGLPSEIFAMGTPPPPMLLVLLVSPTLLAVCAGVGTSPNKAHTLLCTDSASGPVTNRSLMIRSLAASAPFCLLSCK